MLLHLPSLVADKKNVRKRSQEYPDAAQADSPAAQQCNHGLSLYRKGEYLQAIEALRPCCASDDLFGKMARYYHAMSHRSLGIEALREGQFAQAEQHFHKVIQTMGRQGDLSSYLASLFAGTHQYRKCADEMERTAEIDPDSAPVRRKCAQALWQAGRRPEAYMTLTRAIRDLQEDHCELYIQLGLFYAAEDRFDEAQKTLAQAIEADCTDGEAHYYHGLIAAARQDTLIAVRSFQRAFELRPDDLMSAWQLASASKAAEDAGYSVILRLPDPSIVNSGGSHVRQLARYICMEPDFVDAFLSLPASAVDGDLFELLGGVLQMAINEHPSYADLHYRCGRVFHRLGRSQTALEYVMRALAINPRYVQALILAGKLSAEMGQHDQAIEHLRQAISCGGDWADVHCLLGELMNKANRASQAEGHLRRALELNSNYKRAAESLEAMAA